MCDPISQRLRKTRTIFAHKTHNPTAQFVAGTGHLQQKEPRPPQQVNATNGENRAGAMEFGRVQEARPFGARRGRRRRRRPGTPSWAAPTPRSSAPPPPPTRRRRPRRQRRGHPPGVAGDRGRPPRAPPPSAGDRTVEMRGRGWTDSGRAHVRRGWTGAAHVWWWNTDPTVMHRRCTCPTEGRQKATGSAFWLFRFQNENWSPVYAF